MSAAPLAGLRVLDFSHFLAGPYAALVLADLGADVIKIEDPGRPDEARAVGPCWQDEESLYFLSLNWAKRSLAVRYATPPGLSVVLELVRCCDVVLDNFRPGVMTRLGLSFTDLSAINPKIITCSLSGFGESGPYASRPGYDYTIQALTGVMSVTGDPDRSPGKAGISYVDHSGGLAAALAVTSALVERERTGVGQHLEVALMDVQISMLSYLAAWQLNAGLETTRTGSAHPSIVPAQTFTTADGHISLFVGNDAMWSRLVGVVDEAGLRSKDFATMDGRRIHRTYLLHQLRKLFQTRTTEEWLQVMTAARVPCAPVNSISQAMRDPHIVERGLIQSSSNPAYGDYRHVSGPLPALSRASSSGAPQLGEHTATILRDLGYAPDRIRELADTGVVHMSDARAAHDG
jgi:crotonobetainyl-CoA:carnitine CoA-transferase CaiB-like acyl-CoA transferase